MGEQVQLFRGEQPPRRRGVLIVCGGRAYDDQDWMHDILDRAVRNVHVTVLLHGGIGLADVCAERWARARGTRAEQVDLICKGWWGLGRGEIVGCVAFPGGEGTRRVLSACEGAGVPIRTPGLRPDALRQVGG